MSIQDKMADKKKKKESREISFEEFMHAILSDIDPAKYAGEGWYSTEEYALPSDIKNPWTRAEVGREGEYYPGLIEKMRRK